MRNRKTGIIVLLLCFLFHLMPYQALAASTSDAVEPIVPENACSLTASYQYGGTAFSDVEVKLYRIAEVSADFQYTLTSSFEASGLVLNDVRTADEWNAIRSTLEAHILAHNVTADFTAVTNGEGQAVFENLKTGMYFAVVNPIERDGWHYLFDPALIALPALEQDGFWNYRVSVLAKGEGLPPIDSDEKTEFKVLKLWRGDEKRNDRPESVEIEIFCDGILYETVVLSDENRWSYSWSADDSSSVWTVAEKNVPKGYTATVEKRETTFLVTNTRTSTTPEGPGDPPNTGDTSNILLYILLMIISGSILIFLGITGKKKRP